jgi:phytol kinase
MSIVSSLYFRLQIMMPIVVYHAIVASIVTAISFSVLFTLKSLNANKSITNEVSRKVVHIGAGTLHLSLYFYRDVGVYSKYLNVFPYALWTIILLWKSQHPTSKTAHLDDLVVGTITRTRQSSELLRGPLFFNFVAILCGTVYYKTPLGSTIMAILTWGDGLAAIIGSKYGKEKKIFRDKSWAGFFAIFLGGFVMSFVYISLLSNMSTMHLVKLLLISLFAAVAETLSPSDFDNMTIPFAIIVTSNMIH